MSAEFYKTYLQLINLSPDAPPSTFYSTEDYNKLNSLGPSLPKLNYPFPKGKTSAVTDSVIDIQLRSIRPPYKFSTKLSNISVSQSVYKVKDLLISNVSTLKDAGVTQSNLKFMIKSKVITDTTTIASLVQEGAELSFTVMVSPPSAPPSTADSQTPAVPAVTDSSVSVPVILSNETWSKIHEILVADVGPENAGIFLEKFKAVN